jgi:hypothetical protein
LPVSSEWRFIVAAYGITWVVLIAYAAYVELRRQRAARANDGGAP